MKEEDGGGEGGLGKERRRWGRREGEEKRSAWPAAQQAVD